VPLKPVAAIRVRHLALVVFTLSSIAAALAVTHMDDLPAFVVIGPGYVVQAWLFESHRALSGAGYYATMVVVSAAVWTLIILSPVAVIRTFRRFTKSYR
jgi:hypothetical protein